MWWQRWLRGIRVINGQQHITLSELLRQDGSKLGMMHKKVQKINLTYLFIYFIYRLSPVVCLSCVLVLQ